MHSQAGFSDYKGIASGANYTITGGDWGGKRFYGGHKDADILENNYIGVTGGTFGGEICGAFLNTGATGITRNNTVEIKGGTFNDATVTGGNAYYGDSLNNTVIMSGITSFGGNEKHPSITGGWSGENTASGNQVIISNSTILNALIVGGNAATISGKAYGNRVELVNCTYNITSFSTLYDYAIIGGYAKSWPGKGASSVYDNTVVLGGGNSLQADVYLSTLLANGSIDPNYKASEGSNGTLEVRGTNKILCYTDYGYISGDEYKYCGSVYANNATVKFYLTPDLYDGSKVMLAADRTVNLNDSQVQICVDDIIELQNAGEITLLTAGEVEGKIEHEGTTITVTDPLLDIQVQHNGFADNKLTIVGNTLKAKGNEDSKSPVETQAAGVSLINLGGDMISDSSFDSAAIASDAAPGEASSFAPFAAMGGSSVRLNSGSHVDLTSWNINLGVAKKLENKKGQLLFGPLLEYGRGSYDSYLDNGTHGEGNTTYTGAGIMAKQINNDGLYYEGSLRAGQLKNDYQSRLKGSSTSYETRAIYYGFHAGVGKVVKLDEKDSIDYYGKVFYSHQNGDHARLNGSSYSYDFHAMDSLRSRLGMRYNHKINEDSTLYAGLAWQHEFDGRAKASIISGALSFDTPSPSVKGDTGILELGWKIKSNNGRLETGLGLTSSAGKQEGVGLNASFQWNF